MRGTVQGSCGTSFVAAEMLPMSAINAPSISDLFTRRRAARFLQALVGARRSGARARNRPLFRLFEPVRERVVVSVPGPARGRGVEGVVLQIGVGTQADEAL